jgi:electron transfer flavoprotein-quinone oxidoreductase
MMPQLYGDGILVAGDAVGLVLNLGYVVRGMDFAIASGEAAARAVLLANSSSDFSRQRLGVYQQLLKESFVFRDLEAYRNAPLFLENQRMFKAYPQLATGLISKLFTVDGSAPEHLMAMALDQIKKSGISLIQLAGDGWKGGRLL